MSAQEKIQQLQLIEQSLQNLLAQKQSIQMQLAEVESALGELEGKESAYRIVGGIMVAAKAADLTEELTSKKELLELRINTFTKQENDIRQKADTLQKEVLEEMKHAKQ